MRIPNRSFSPQSQKGFGIVDAMIAILVLMTIMTIRLAYDAQDADRVWAGRLGQEVRMLNDSIAELLASEPGTPVGVYANFNFLRHTSCPGGTANRHYLPCDFRNDNTLVGQFFQNTQVTQIGSGVPGNTIQIGTTLIGPISRTPGGSDAVVAGMAGAIAQGYSLDVNSPVFATTRARYTLDRPTATLTVVTTSNPDSDAWLRTDGGNFMNADITFSLDGGGQPRSDIVNARDVIAQRFVDHDNNNFFVDPAGRSELENVDIGGELLIDDDASIESPVGDLDVNAADGVTINAGTGRTVLEGDGVGEGMLEANDIILRAYNNAFTLSDILPPYSAQAGYLARHHDLVIKPDCPAGASPKIIINTGFRVGADGAEQVRDERVFSTDFACDGDLAPAARGPRCNGAVPTLPNRWTVRYINPVNEAEYIEDERVVMTYCYFPKS